MASVSISVDSPEGDVSVSFEVSEWNTGSAEDHIKLALEQASLRALRAYGIAPEPHDSGGSDG